MFTSVFMVAGFMVLAIPESPQWRTDYYAAREQMKDRGKPLAVFVGSGNAGWNQLCSDGKLSKEASRLLAEKYVCVYVDTNKPGGKQLAAEFELSDKHGLVISDLSGHLQAFRHEGELADKDLQKQLDRYADPQRVVRITETTSRQRVSNYYSDEAPAYRPAYESQSFSGRGRSC